MKLWFSSGAVMGQWMLLVGRVNMGKDETRKIGLMGLMGGQDRSEAGKC
jgi:hypothetical protein